MFFHQKSFVFDEIRIWRHTQSGGNYPRYLCLSVTVTDGAGDGMCSHMHQVKWDYSLSESSILILIDSSVIL